MGNAESGDWVRSDAWIFLALCMLDGESSLADLMGPADWLNRAIPSAEELHGAINRLSAAGLVHAANDRFRVPHEVRAAYDAFARRRKRERFDTAFAFLRKHPLEPEVPATVSIDAAGVEAAYQTYRRRFNEAARRAQSDEDE